MDISKKATINEGLNCIKHRNHLQSLWKKILAFAVVIILSFFIDRTATTWSITVSNMETALLLGSLLLQVRSIICDPTWSKSDPSWRPVSIFESVIHLIRILMHLEELNIQGLSYKYLIVKINRFSEWHYNFTI